jgi:hypothetical protein
MAQSLRSPAFTLAMAVPMTALLYPAAHAKLLKDAVIVTE